MSAALRHGSSVIGPEMLTTLEQEVRPEHAAVLAVDVQNDCCARGGDYADGIPWTRVIGGRRVSVSGGATRDAGR